MALGIDHKVSGSIDLNLPSGWQDQLAAILTKLGDIMSALDDLKAAMATEDTKVQGLIAAFKDLTAKLAAAVAANDPAALQALVTEANATSAAIDAVNPPAPAPAVGTIPTA